MLRNLSFVLLAACRLGDVDDCTTIVVAPGETVSCTVPGYVDRGFDLRVPASWDGVSPLPVILALHGGGAFRKAADSVSCPDGNSAAPECLGTQATARGYALVSPDGIGSRPLRGVRTWNAGGGRNGFICGFGAACALDIDDVKYVDDVFTQVAAAIQIDAARVYSTGISNGGGMTHRLGCEGHDRFAAIAPVAGTNIHADSGGPCAVSVPILDLHGTGDPIWPYDGGKINEAAGMIDGVEDTLEGWRTRNGCAATFVDTPMPDLDPGDGTSAVRRVWDGCASATERIRIVGGGHTWPQGRQYLSTDIIGAVTQDFGTEIILDFFDAHPHR